MLETVVEYLRPLLGDRGPTAELLAETFLSLPEACRSARLTAAAASRVDRILARHVLRTWDGRRAFHDPGCRLPYGALLLVEPEAERARQSLLDALGPASAAAGRRADLWGYLGDACLLLVRLGEANAAYVRALVIEPWRVDLHRTRAEALRSLHGRLTADRPFEEAVGLLLAAAWIEGAVRIEPGNAWLAGEKGRLRERGPEGARTSAAWRAGRFSLLPFLDRSLPAGRADRAAREEMQALEPELFARFMGRLRDLEETAAV